MPPLNRSNVTFCKTDSTIRRLQKEMRHETIKPRRISVPFRLLGELEHEQSHNPAQVSWPPQAYHADRIRHTSSDFMVTFPPAENSSTPAPGSLLTIVPTGQALRSAGVTPTSVPESTTATPSACARRSGRIPTDSSRGKHLVFPGCSSSGSRHFRIEPLIREFRV
jgi:hypothetical protein